MTSQNNQVPLVLRTMWRNMSMWIGLFLLGFILIYLVIDVGVLTFSKTAPSTSMVDIAAAGGPKYVLFSFGITVIWMMMQTYVAFGVTRRHLAIALGIFALSVTAILAVVIVLSFAAEHAVYVANGLPFKPSGYSYQSGADVIPLFLQNWIVFYAHLVAGGLIVMAYARTGAWFGTLLIPVALVPILITEGVFGAKWIGVTIDALLRTVPAPWPIAAVISFLTCGLASAIVYLIMRRLPIGQKLSQIKY